MHSPSSCFKLFHIYILPESVLVGADEQSVGWDILERKIFYNGCAIKGYPETKPSSYKVPEKFTMILNMDQGSLSFKADVRINIFENVANAKIIIMPGDM